MLPRPVKQVFYDLAGPLMWINGQRHRYFSRPRTSSDGRVKVQLGPGQRNYLDNWINVDANAFTGKCDRWADLRNTLPFPDTTVDAVYSHHVIEHLPDLMAHFADVYRILKPGAVYRVGGPNGDVAIRKFVERDLSWFGEWPDRRESIGGRFVNFVFCRNEHLTMLTESYLQEIATGAGFGTGKVMLPRRQTEHPEVFNVCLEKEREEDLNAPRTLIMEFKK